MALTYDIYGNVIQSQDEMGHVTTKAYDGQGYVRTITDALGHTTTMDYHHSGKVTEYTDAAGKTTQNTFDANGNLLSTTDPSGSVFSFEYDENEQQTVTTSTVTTANGVESVRLEKVYDSLNQVTEQIDADGLSTKAEYDALGRQTATIDKLGNRTEISYDARNLPTKQVGPDDSSSSSSYDVAGRMTAQTDALGRTTQYAYDAVGNVTHLTNPDGTSVDHEYDALGRLVATTSSTGLSTSREYDAAGRLIAETDVLDRTTRYEYYPDGKRKKMIDPRGNEFTFEYDARGHQTAMSFPDGSSVTYEYNEQGKKISETDQLGYTTSFDWNDLGLLQEITDPLGQTTSYSYNEIGNLLSQTDANGHTTSFEYNKLGRRTKKTYPIGMSQSTSYDVANRTVSVTDFNGATTTSQYDTLGRVVTTTFPDGSSQSYTYTSSGQIASVTDRHGTTQYQYDSDERLTSVTDANGATISYSYDEFGRKQTVTTPSGTTGYGYDTYGRLTSVTDPDGAETRYTYDEHGNKASMMYPNGTITEYGYDNLNRLISVETRTITNDLLAAYSYTLNSKGQRTHVEEQPIGRSIDYEYDAADRLIEERISDPVLGNRTISYSYDPVGNRLTKDECPDAQPCVSTSYAYDDNDRLLTETGYAYTYDDNGNLLTKIGNGEEWQLTYNALNQVEHADISTSQGTSSLAYTYDHDGIRMDKTINGTEMVQYVVDKNRPYAQVLEETHTRGGLSATTSYVYGDTLISAATEGSTYYYHTDGLGSVRHLSDASGALTDSYTYDAYGLFTTSSGTTVNPYLYRGEQYDAALNAYYLRARNYQPGTGRFLTTDPEEGFTSSPISLHRYVYGNASPVNYNDPSGGTSLRDLTVTQVVLGNLAAIGVGMSLEPYFGVYSTLGKSVFPDAYIAGISGAFSLRLLKDIPLFENTPLSIPSMYHTTDIMFSGGFELLLNISSGQIALYSVLPFFNGNPLLPIPGFGAGGIPFSPDNNKKTGFSCAVYQGYVWNLWNADDYTEHFVNFGVASANAFFDPTRVFAVPWGISRTLFNKSWPKNSTSHKFSYLRSSTYSYYQIIGSPRNYADEWQVCARAAVLSVAGNLLAAKMNPTSSAWKFFVYADPSMWTHATISKYYWNKKSGYNVNFRQTHTKRPDDFQSGPSLAIFSLFGGV